MKKPRKVTTGQLVNKLERAIAIANMRGDRAAADRLSKMLESAVNSTQMPKVLA